MKKVLAVEGSPRAGGNTEKLVKAILEGASESGAETEFHKLSKMKITPCQGCVGCREKGVCLVDDDMRILYARIQACDVVVVGSPVYMWQMSAQTKAFLDRLVVFVKPDFTTRLNGKKGLHMAFTQGNPDENAFRFYFEYVERMLSMMFDVKGTIVATGTREKNDISKNRDILEKARDIGKGLAL